MPQIRHSRQREAILSFLKDRTDHPTADVIFENVRQDLPNISLGTVYRNLSLLSDRGEILRITPGDGKEHFDACTAPHTHFICRSCGALLDLDYRMPAGAIRSAQSAFDGLIERSEVHFIGLCGDCREKEAPAL